MAHRHDPVAPTAATAAVYGSSGGFTTFVANAAGPILNTYLVRLGLGKDELVGTSAWFYFAVNVAKVPVYLALGTWSSGGPFFTGKSLAFDAALLPAVLDRRAQRPPVVAQAAREGIPDRRSGALRRRRDQAAAALGAQRGGSAAVEEREAAHRSTPLSLRGHATGRSAAPTYRRLVASRRRAPDSIDRRQPSGRYQAHRGARSTGAQQS